MREPNSGNKSHTAGEDRDTSSSLHWWDVSAETLWEFTTQLCARMGYRKAAEVTGVSKAGLQKYVEGLSKPNRTTRQLLGELFLERYPSGVMRKRDVDGEWQLRPRLIELLPQSEMQARREMAKLFELARRFPDEAPDFIDQVERWVDLQIQGEWWAERKHSSFAVRQREWNRESRELQSRLKRLMKAVKAEEEAEREAKRKAREESATLPPDDPTPPIKRRARPGRDPDHGSEA